MEVFTFVVGRIHVDNLHRIFIPHCWINTGQTPKGYAIMLKVWVAFLVLCFFFVVVLFGIISKIRALQIESWETSTGDPTQ